MRLDFLIFSLLVMMIVLSLGCVETQQVPEPQKTPKSYETPSISETPYVFETWSRGDWSSLSYKQPYFRVITNYSEWNEFLEDQGYFARLRGGAPKSLEGRLFPGENIKPKEIAPSNFDDHFIIAAMMGLKPIAYGPEIEIKNISRLNTIVNVVVRMYDPGIGVEALSAPYHIVIVKRELLPKGNSTFIFRDTEGKEIGKIEVKG